MNQITKGGHGIPEATLKRINEALSKPLKTGTNGPRVRGNRVVDAPAGWVAYTYQEAPTAVPDTSDGSFTITTSGIAPAQPLDAYQQYLINNQRAYISSPQELFGIQSGAAIPHLQEQYSSAQSPISNINSIFQDNYRDALNSLMPDSIINRLNTQD